MGWNIPEFDESFIKSCNKVRDEGYFLEIDVKYPEKFHDFQNDLPFLPEIIKIEKSGKAYWKFTW